MAAVALPVETRLTIDSLARRKVPATFVSANVATEKDVARLLGSRPVISFEAGDPILLSALSTGPSDGGIPAQLAPSMRAVWLEIRTPVELNLTVRPGDHVDVLAQGKDFESGHQVVTTAVQDRVVIAVRPKAVALELTPDEASLTTLASDLGFLSLALRPVGDHGRGDAGFASSKDLFAAPR